MLIRPIEGFLDACATVMRVAANVILAVMLALNVVNITIRMTRNFELTYVLAWTEVLFVWMTFLGFFVIVRLGRDITIDFLVDRLGRAGMIVSRIVANLVILAMVGIILSQMSETMVLQEGKLEIVGIDRFYLSVPLFLSSALIVVHSVLDLVRAAVGDDGRSAARASHG